MFIQKNKLVLRQACRKRRDQISVQHRQTAAVAAVDLLINYPIFRQSQAIACYLPYKNEFDTMPLIKAIWQAGKSCYLPVLTDDNHLLFVRYNEGDQLKINQYGIAEPIMTDHQLLPAALDLVLVPLLAFDEQGNRLGTGGGYYDRTFSFRLHSATQTPKLFGLAYAMQALTVLPNDEWDVLLDGVVTEEKIIVMKPR